LHSVARLRDNRQDEKELRPVIGTAICLSSTFIIIFSGELARFFPDQWVGVTLVFAVSTFVLSVSRWIGEDFRNKLSKEE